MVTVRCATCPKCLRPLAVLNKTKVTCLCGARVKLISKTREL